MGADGSAYVEFAVRVRDVRLLILVLLAVLVSGGIGGTVSGNLIEIGAICSAIARIIPIQATSHGFATWVWICSRKWELPWCITGS
jgi:hypothetical protein